MQQGEEELGWLSSARDLSGRPASSSGIHMPTFTALTPPTAITSNKWIQLPRQSADPPPYANAPVDPILISTACSAGIPSLF